MWLASVLILTCLFVAISWKWGPQLGIGIVVPLAWLLPAWILLPLFEGPNGSIVGTGIDIKVAVSIACVCLYCVMPGRTFPLRLVPCDFAVAALIGLHVCSDTLVDGFRWVFVGRACAEWYLPYICGRLALQSRLDVSRLWWAPGSAAVLLAIAALPECFRDINVFELIFGERPLEGTNRGSMRWGVQRAYGPAMHPIYFGVVQLLLLGWATYASLRALRRKATAWWVFAFLPPLAGIGACASRGPILGILVSVFASVFLGIPKSRWLIAGLSVVGIFTLVALREPVIAQIEHWSKDRQREIVIDGEETVQSSARSRLNMIAVYTIAARRSGLFGFGSEAVAGFPVNVPIGPQELRTVKAVRYIDNTYVLLTLRFGYLGLAAFVLSAGCAFLQFLWIANRHAGSSPAWLAACVGGTMTSSLAVLMTVWMPHEIGFVLLWTFGISSGLAVAELQGKLGHIKLMRKSKGRGAEETTQYDDRRRWKRRSAGP